MTKRLGWVAAILAVVCAAPACRPAAAQAIDARRVDDSGTVVSVPLVQMRWRQLVPGRGEMNDVDGELDVALRLNLGPWVKREVRLYLVLEPSSVPGTRITARWRAGGLLQAGLVQSGGRVLVYQGLVRDVLMQERLHFTLTTDGTRLPPTQAMQFHIEAETR